MTNQELFILALAFLLWCFVFFLEYTIPGHKLKLFLSKEK